MAGFDDLKFIKTVSLEEVSLEEPSPHVDRIVRSFARTRLRDIRGHWRRVTCLRLLSAAAILLVVTGLIMTERYIHRSKPEPLSVAVEASHEQVVDLDRAVEQLRTDIEQIEEMSALIPDERDKEREEITMRVRACLADLEKLEREIGKGNSTSHSSYHAQRKVINI